MTAKLSLFVVSCVALPFYAPAQQLDSTALRAKYGDPLARETFQVRPNIEAIVTYGPDHQVCRIELPPGRNIVGGTSASVATTRQVDEVVDELAPLAMRGKRIGRGLAGVNGLSMGFASYEHVSITEPHDPDHPERRTGVTITFNRPDCH